MAKKILSTDFKDDVLASTMSEKRRYREIQNIDGTVSFEDVTDYTQIGSTFGAGQINAMNEAANNSFDASKIIDDYDTLLANTQSGYAAGALAVKELNSNLSKCQLKPIALSNLKTTKIVLGYKPSVVIAIRLAASTYIPSEIATMDFYNADYSATKIARLVPSSATSEYSLNTSNRNMIASIDDDGFTAGVEGGTGRYLIYFSFK